LEGPCHGQHTPIEVDILPPKSQQLAPAHPGRERQDQERLQTLPFGSLEKPVGLIAGGDRIHLNVPDLGPVRPTYERGNVAPQNAVVHGSLQGHMNDRME
jgi:hypothetical protein